jgi:hypothetical protein
MKAVQVFTRNWLILLVGRLGLVLTKKPGK